MTAQYLNTLTIQGQITTDDETPQSHLQLLYRNILNKTLQIPLLKNMVSLEAKTTATAQSIGTGKLISKKMRVKLINWLQKLSLETFQFSTQTLILTIRVLDQYLCLTNQSPAQLQLIGCAALYLAAKTSEPVIIAGQCYVTASANCFSEQQLIEKEMEIYKTLNFNTTFCSLVKVYNVLRINQFIGNTKTNRTNTKVCFQYSKNQVDGLLVEIAKNLDFLQWKSHKIVSMLIAMIEVKKNLPTLVQLQEKLVSFSGC